MLRTTIALAFLGLWALHASAFAAKPAGADLPLVQVALGTASQAAAAEPLPDGPSLGLADPFEFQLLSLPQSTQDHPRKEDWLESDGQWRPDWFLPDSPQDSALPKPTRSNPR